MYIDFDQDFTGMLLLEIDKQNRCYKEIFFKQCNNANTSELRDILYNNIVSLDCDCNNMIVGFNCRTYDLRNRLPSLLESACISTDNINDISININKRVRDLMDICIKRNISVKGDNKKEGVPWMTGLFTVVDNMIGYFDGNADKELEKKYRKALDRFRVSFWEAPTLWNADIKKEYTGKNMHKLKNEADVRALPLLEDALGFLYSERMEDDDYKNEGNYKKEMI